MKRKPTKEQEKEIAHSITKCREAQYAMNQAANICRLGRCLSHAEQVTNYDAYQVAKQAHAMADQEFTELLARVFPP